MIRTIHIIGFIGIWLTIANIPFNDAISYYRLFVAPGPELSMQFGYAWKFVAVMAAITIALLYLGVNFFGNQKQEFGHYENYRELFGICVYAFFGVMCFIHVLTQYLLGVFPPEFFSFIRSYPLPEVAVLIGLGSVVVRVNQKLAPQ